jgi:hypothetical protein
LPSAAFPIQNGTLGEIRLTPLNGLQLTLSNFALAGYPRATQPDQTVRVTDGTSNTILFDDSPFDVTGQGRDIFNVNLVSTGPLVIQFGPSWNTGINYINYSVGPGGPDPNPNPVPEPATMFLLGTGLASIGGMIKRRRQDKKD